MHLIRNFILASAIFSAFLSPVYAAEEYTISDEFDGCDYGKLYELDGGGILECQEYNYFYEYRPQVIASGREVVVIGDEKVSAFLHDGAVIKTKISDDFEGCDYDKVYPLDNGLLFQCDSYSYSYSYRPEVKIFMMDNATPKVFIKGKEYKGTLFKP